MFYYDLWTLMIVLSLITEYKFPTSHKILKSQSKHTEAKHSSYSLCSMKTSCWQLELLSNIWIAIEHATTNCSWILDGMLNE